VTPEPDDGGKVENNELGTGELAANNVLGPGDVGPGDIGPGDAEPPDCEFSAGDPDIENVDCGDEL
jgi:hypothetical protein